MTNRYYEVGRIVPDAVDLRRQFPQLHEAGRVRLAEIHPIGKIRCIPVEPRRISV
jgi:hypothetical protein